VQSLAALSAMWSHPLNLGPAAGLRTDGSPAIEIPRRRRAAPSPAKPDDDDMFPMPRLSDPAHVARTVLGDR